MATEKFSKQPRETIDIDFDFTEWLASKTGRSAVSYEVDVPSGLTVSHDRAGTVVHTYSAGLVPGKYLLTVRLTTDGATPLVKELEAYVVVKERP